MRRETTRSSYLRRTAECASAEQPSIATLGPGPGGYPPSGVLGMSGTSTLTTDSALQGLSHSRRRLDGPRMHSYTETSLQTMVTPSVAARHASADLYRASSGALVFGAARCSVLGLDTTHAIAVPLRYQYAAATVNLLADMGVQPVTLQAGSCLRLLQRLPPRQVNDHFACRGKQRRCSLSRNNFWYSSGFWWRPLSCR